LSLLHHRFGLSAFLLPFLIRTVPEIIVGPYPVGFDPIAFYIPTTVDWASSGVDPLTILGTAPLLFFLSVPAYSLFQVSPVWIFKLLGPILYGSLGWAMYRFLRVGPRWCNRKGLLCCLFASIYFVTLRIGWDSFRIVLGLTFMLLLLPLLDREKPDDRPSVIATLLVATIASDQLTGILALLIVGSRMIQDLSGRRANRMLLPFGLGSIALTAVVYSFFSLPNSLFPIPPLSQTAWGLPSGLSFLGYAFLPLIPFLIVGAKRGVSFRIKMWISICVSFALIAVLPFPLFRETSYRWTLLMDIPICIIAFTGVENVFVALDHLPKVRLLRGLARVALPGVFVSMAVLYLVLPANIAMPYYTQFPDFVPTSMVQNTVPSYDMENLVQALIWVANQSRFDMALITHQAIYGWARIYFPYSGQIVNYYYANPLEGVHRAQSLGFSSIYLVWWMNSTGWYGMPSVPSSFVVVHETGNFDVYKYGI